MRIIAIGAAMLLASASTAFAAPASVSVTIGPELQKKAMDTLGVRDVDYLVKELQTDVEKRLAKTGAYGGATIELVLTDVQPNHPTFKQLGDKPGLSYESFGIGGAKIVGRAVAPDGAVTPLHYTYYEPSIAWSRRGGTWADAQYALSDFAYRLGRGEAIATR